MPRLRYRTMKRAGRLPGHPEVTPRPLDDEGRIEPLAEPRPPRKTCAECFGPRSTAGAEDTWFCLRCETWLFQVAKPAALRERDPARQPGIGYGGSCRVFLRGERRRTTLRRNAAARAAEAAREGL